MAMAMQMQNSATAWMALAQRSPFSLEGVRVRLALADPQSRQLGRKN
jgi:hypothetical protein